MLNVNTVEKPLEQRNIVKNTRQRPRVPKPKAPPKKIAAPQKNPFTNYPTPQTHPKPPLTLAQLTQGFLNQRKEDSGSYGISMLGRKSGIPSDEQMKYERYLQKLSYCLDNSFNIHKYNQPQLSDDTEIYLFFQLNRDGILEQLSVRKSSGSAILDNFVVFVFRQASQSFPPVPSYLPDNPFRMNYVISIRRMTY
jgi:TonB family protein